MNPRYKPDEVEFYRALFMAGPVKEEARRLARNAISKAMLAKGSRFDYLSPQAQETKITQLIFANKEKFYIQAKFNLDERG